MPSILAWIHILPRTGQHRFFTFLGVWQLELMKNLDAWIESCHSFAKFQFWHWVQSYLQAIAFNMNTHQFR
jgi:hypothetical protein